MSFQREKQIGDALAEAIAKMDASDAAVATLAGLAADSYRKAAALLDKIASKASAKKAEPSDAFYYDLKKRCRVRDEKVDAFVEDLVAVYRKHDSSVSHEDGNGAFVIEEFLEQNVARLRGAHLNVEETS